MAYLSSKSDSLPDVVLDSVCPNTFDFLFGTSASLETASSNLHGQEGNEHVKTVQKPHCARNISMTCCDLW